MNKVKNPQQLRAFLGVNLCLFLSPIFLVGFVFGIAEHWFRLGRRKGLETILKPEDQWDSEPRASE
jgi:hypothetical protein